MNHVIRSLLLIFLIFCSGETLPQATLTELDNAYGLDPVLFNGRKYAYFLPPGTGGDQFFRSAEYVPGSVVIRWKGDKVMTYNSSEAGRHGGMGFFLNYDVYNQKLLLKYIDETGAEQIIEVSEAWLDSFSLGLYNFTYFKTGDGEKIYQVLGDDKYRVYYSWRKSLKLSNSTSPPTYVFSEPAKSRFINIGGQLFSFGSNGSFTANFDPALRERIKEYMKEHDISVKKASDLTMTELVNYISKLE